MKYRLRKLLRWNAWNPRVFGALEILGYSSQALQKSSWSHGYYFGPLCIVFARLYDLYKHCVSLVDLLVSGG